MSGRLVSAALVDVFSRLREEDGQRYTRDMLVRDLGTIPGASTALTVVDEDVDDLTLGDFRSVIALAASRVAPKLPQPLCRFASLTHILRTFTNRETLEQMARIDPAPMPRSLPSDLAREGHLVRPAHAFADHWPVPVSTELFGARLQSYFYISGASFPDRDPSSVRKKLLAHDSDEFVIFLGCANNESRSSDEVEGVLPLYLESHPDPYERVEKPICLKVNEWFIFDANAPHYWFATPNSVALFVGASVSEAYRRPVAFRWHHEEAVPGGQYPLFPPDGPSVESDRTSYIIGKRLRRRRDSYGISAREIENVRRRRERITANIVGKIENDTVPNVRVGTITALAAALDLTFSELISLDPLWRLEGQPLNDLNEEKLGRLERGKQFAIAPSLVRPSHPAADGELLLHEGEADVVLFVLEGTVDVYVVPDPLPLVLELKEQLAMDDANGAKKSIRLTALNVERFIGTRFLKRDRVTAKQAYQFNAALPHAVLASSGDPVVLVVTTHADAALPKEWTESSSSTAQRTAPKQQVKK